MYLRFLRFCHFLWRVLRNGCVVGFSFCLLHGNFAIILVGQENVLIATRNLQRRPLSLLNSSLAPSSFQHENTRQETAPNGRSPTNTPSDQHPHSPRYLLVSKISDLAMAQNLEQRLLLEVAVSFTCSYVNCTGLQRKAWRKSMRWFKMSWGGKPALKSCHSIKMPWHSEIPTSHCWDLKGK